jgi:hypothetical protein
VLHAVSARISAIAPFVTLSLYCRDEDGDVIFVVGEDGGTIVEEEEQQTDEGEV